MQRIAMKSKRKAHKQTVSSSLCAAKNDMVLTSPPVEAAPISHSHKTELGEIRNIHGRSLLSVNDLLFDAAYWDPR